MCVIQKSDIVHDKNKPIPPPLLRTHKKLCSQRQKGGVEEMLVVNSKQEAMSIKAETPVAALTAAFTVVP